LTNPLVDTNNQLKGTK